MIAMNRRRQPHPLQTRANKLQHRHRGSGIVASNAVRIEEQEGFSALEGLFEGVAEVGVEGLFG
jgi:hypothetical protein